MCQSDAMTRNSAAKGLVRGDQIEIAHALVSLAQPATLSTQDCRRKSSLAATRSALDQIPRCSEFSHFKTAICAINSEPASFSVQGVARLLSSDRHAAAVEAREGEAVEGFAEGSALVPQHADSHFLAERH